jgi:hypothetical protein
MGSPPVRVVFAIHPLRVELERKVESKPWLVYPGVIADTVVE